jgi:ABC-2 type transport system ATP-binding protein
MLLHIDNLRLSLGGNTILSDVHLALREGEIYGLLGPNGAGKSTTIAAALGLLPADGGTLTLLGQPVGKDMARLRRRLGVLPEQNGFYDWMSATEYLAFYASLYGKDLREPEIAARLSQVGLAPRGGQAIGTFSHGMRQRLGLARALIPDPDLLILDEPTNGLDPRGRREIHDILLALVADGAGILLCTHLLDDVDRLCSRVGIIVAGRTVAEGAIADLVRQGGPLTRFRLRLVGEPPAGQAAATLATVVAREGEWWQVELDASARPDNVWRELLFRGWPIVEIERTGGGLEDLYLALTERSAA